MATEKAFYTVSEAARIIGCTTGWVRILLRDGILSGTKLFDNEKAPWLLDKKPVHKYAATEQTTGRPRSGK